MFVFWIGYTIETDKNIMGNEHTVDYDECERSATAVSGELLDEALNDANVWSYEYDSPYEYRQAAYERILYKCINM